MFYCTVHNNTPYVAMNEEHYGDGVEANWACYEGVNVGDSKDYLEVTRRNK
jgi:hypothetical protein